MKPRSLLIFRLKPSLGDADLEVWDGRAKTIYGSTRLRGGISQRSGRHADVLAIRNLTRSAIKLFVDAFVPSNARLLNASYKLTVRRPRR